MKELDRREFLRGLARQAALGGLLAGTGYLVLRPVDEAEARDCLKAIQCGTCAVFGDCTLPRAVGVRRASADQRSEGPHHA